MAFSTFSKDFTANMFTSVENQFITKYLPQADGDAVRVYLYGLYLCQCAEEFDALSCAKLLRISPERLLSIFDFWEECDLVQVLSREPLYVQYLPVNATIGKPKPIRAEKYAQFNKEFYRQLQTAGVMFKPYEMQRILEFLENSPMEQQAFLLVSAYCAKKDGNKLTCAHVLNKAKKLCAEYKYTFEQVEKELADYNVHERELSKLFTLLSINRKPKEEDYELIEKWLTLGFEFPAIRACAMAIKKGTLFTLDQVIVEVHEHDCHSLSETKEYLTRRETVTSLVYQTGKKLSVKIQNPRAYAEEYAEKWLERGYDEESILPLASLCFKLRFGFSELDGILETLYQNGIVDTAGVKAYCDERESQLRLLQKLQATCGVIKKTTSALDMVATWRSWNFSDAMILEAGKRSANASAPLPYMNKLLSEWKRANVSEPAQIPDMPTTSTATQGYKSEAIISADLRSERERYYSILRTKAQEQAEKAVKKAEENAQYKEATAQIRKGEIELAKAEVFSPDQVENIKKTLKKWQDARTSALQILGLTEEDFLPVYTCKKCSDSGFLPNGRACSCYPKK